MSKQWALFDLNILSNYALLFSALTKTFKEVSEKQCFFAFTSRCLHFFFSKRVAHPASHVIVDRLHRCYQACIMQTVDFLLPHYYCSSISDFYGKIGIEDSFSVGDLFLNLSAELLAKRNSLSSHTYTLREEKQR